MKIRSASPQNILAATDLAYNIKKEVLVRVERKMKRLFYLLLFKLVAER